MTTHKCPQQSVAVMREVTGQSGVAHAIDITLKTDSALSSHIALAPARLLSTGRRERREANMDGHVYSGS